MTKTILITGSTDGIGLLTAKILAEQGHKILLHGRNAEKLETARAEVTGDPLIFQADLSSLDETKELAASVTDKVQSVDVLINNAGVYKTGNPILANGQDSRFVVNTLAPYVLTKALLPIIPKTGRVINLSSAAQAPVSLGALEGASHLDHMGAYAQSKRAITLWTQNLAKKFPEGPTVIAVNPGSLLASKMVKEGFGVAGHDLRIGADILCSLSLEGRFEKHTGEYWDNDSGGFAPVDMSQTDAVMAVIEEMVKQYLPL